MKKEIRENQALYSHILDFDPVIRKRVKVEPAPVDPTDKSGTRIAIPASGRFSKQYENYNGVRVLDDGSVEVRFYAPDAKRVEIAGNGGSMPGRYDLEPQGDGYWRTLLTDVGPGFHYHEYYVDGVLTYNPAVPFGYGCSFVMNYFEVPDPNEDFYLLKDVPHGTLHMEVFKSDVQGGRFRNLWVYTPPGYEADTDKRYPVMYIHHGGGENETGWFWQGKTNYIADNLLAEGKMVEMIIVASAMSSPKEVEDGVFENADYSSVMIDEIIPLIDKKYRTLADREHRAVSGLSAGGGQARALAHGHPEVFAHLGQFSCGAGFMVNGGYSGEDDYSELFKTPEHYNSVFKKTFISCGTLDPRHKFTEPQVAELAEKGYNVQYHPYPGHHEWDVWRYSVRDFMSELFK